MPISTGIFSSEANFDDRLITDLEELKKRVGHLKGIGLKVVLTSGSFDLVHLGHVKYLEEAKKQGDVLIVGVDSDEKIRQRKGPDRPMVGQDERTHMLAYQRPVDVIVLKDVSHPKWALIKTVVPDVLVLSEDHGYSDADLKQMEKYCGEIVVLERQWTTTTSERIRTMHMNLADRLGEEIPRVVDEILKGNR